MSTEPRVTIPTTTTLTTSPIAEDGTLPNMDAVTVPMITVPEVPQVSSLSASQFADMPAKEPSTEMAAQSLSRIPAAPARFLTLDGVASSLDVSRSQAYALVRSGALPAIKVGGRGQWRVERVWLEAYISMAYTATREYVGTNPMHHPRPSSDPTAAPTDHG